MNDRDENKGNDAEQDTHVTGRDRATIHGHDSVPPKPGDSNAEEPGLPTGEYYTGNAPERVIMSGIPEDPAERAEAMIRAERRTPVPPPTRTVYGPTTEYDKQLDDYHDDFVGPNSRGEREIDPDNNPRSMYW